MMHRWRTTLVTGAALGAALVLACGQEGQSAAGTGGGMANSGGQPEPRISTRHAGDAHAYVRGSYLVLVTSEDLDMAPVSYPGEIVNGSPRQNLFPMDTTWVHYLAAGNQPQTTGNWQEAAILEESSISWFIGVFYGPSYHLWGPDMAYRPDEDANYLYAPDLRRQKTDASQVGVWRSRGFAGPFTQHGPVGTGDDGLVRIDGFTQGPTGYVSDPNVLTVEGPNPARYFLWADGDFDTEGIACGGIAIGRLQNDMRNVTDAHEIRIQGLPEITNTDSLCYKRSQYVKQSNAEGYAQFGVPEPRPYIESPALYYLTKEKDGVNSGSMPYYLIFPVNFNDGNQSLAYARASDPMGEFVYQGIILPDGNEWTTHGSIVKWGEDWILFYHERDTNADGLGRDRMVHATCLTFDTWSGKIKAGNGGSLPLDRNATSNGYGINCAKRYGVTFQVSASAARKDSSGKVISLAAGVTGTMPDGQTFTCGAGQNCTWIAGLGGNLGFSPACSTGKVSWTGCTSRRGTGCSVSNIKANSKVTLTCLP